MRREEVVNLLARFTPTDVPKIVLVMKNGTALNIDLVFRCEPGFIVFRGRESGTNDDGRGFFVPYEDILFVKLERMVLAQDFEAMFRSDSAAGSADDPFADTAPKAEAVPEPVEEEKLDPASIAKKNLLERIRAARTSAGAPKPGGK